MIDAIEVIVIAVIVVTLVWAGYVIIKEWHYQNLCLDLGYAEAKWFLGRGYCCVGVRDGRSMVVPVGEVGK